MKGNLLARIKSGLIVGSLILTGGLVTAQADARPGRGVDRIDGIDSFRPVRPVPGPGWGRPGRGLKEIYLNQNYRGQNILALRQLLNIGPEYRGQSVEYVVLTADTAAGRGQASLLINRMQVGAAKTVGRRTQDYYFYPNRMAELGQDIRGLQLQLRGNFFVSKIAVKLSRRSMNREIIVPVHQRHIGQSKLHVRQLLNLGPEHRGKRIEYIILKARTDGGRGQAQLVINGQREGMSQTVGRMGGNYYFYPRFGGELGRDIRSLQIDLRGRFTVQAVGVKFAGGMGPNPRPRPIPRPRPPRRGGRL